MKKRMLTAMLTATISMLVGATLLTACAEDKGSNSTANTANTAEETTQSEETAQPGYNLNFELVNPMLKEPDLLGITYYTAYLKNTGDCPITSFEMVFAYTDMEGNRSKTYMSTYDTILPGETSTIMECFGSNDMELLKGSITVLDPEGNSHLFEYDAKLDKTVMVY